MIKIETFIPSQYSDCLDDYFCELEHSNWTLSDLHHKTIWNIVAYFEDEKEAINSYNELKEQFDFLPENPDSIEFLEEADWKEKYKQFLKAWNYKNLHLVPLWEKNTYDKAKDGDVCFFFDAGLAFGTGDHPTTRLCTIRMTDYAINKNNNLDDIELIDAGCGSGILSICGLLLGFKNVQAFDIDPEAVKVAKENLIENSFKANDMLITCNGIEDGLEGKKADILLANIQADILQNNMSHFLNAIKENGVLILSGILVEELQSTKEAFVNKANEIWGGNTFEVESQDMGQWSDLCLKRI